MAAVESGLRRALEKMEPARSKVVGDISKAAPPPPLNGRLMPWFYIWIRLAPSLDALDLWITAKIIGRVTTTLVQTAKGAQTRSPSTPDCVLCALPNLPVYQALSQSSVTPGGQFSFTISTCFTDFIHMQVLQEDEILASSLTLIECQSRPSSVSGPAQTTGGQLNL